MGDDNSVILQSRVAIFLKMPWNYCTQKTPYGWDGLTYLATPQTRLFEENIFL